jgi:Cys-tRNA synthase (O-phospho-L-seryl-tRNA:Cys-tRNA synthase)
MEYKFLDKVVNQIVSETNVIKNRLGQQSPHEHGRWLVQAPFSRNRFTISYLQHKDTHFYVHVSNVYGLNEEEIDYVWDEYRKIINKKV